MQQRYHDWCTPSASAWQLRVVSRPENKKLPSGKWLRPGLQAEARKNKETAIGPEICRAPHRAHGPRGARADPRTLRLRDHTWKEASRVWGQRSRGRGGAEGGGDASCGYLNSKTIGAIEWIFKCASFCFVEARTRPLKM